MKTTVLLLVSAVVSALLLAPSRDVIESKIVMHDSSQIVFSSEAYSDSITINANLQNEKIAFINMHSEQSGFTSNEPRGNGEHSILITSSSSAKLKLAQADEDIISIDFFDESFQAIASIVVRVSRDEYGEYAFSQEGEAIYIPKNDCDKIPVYGANL